MRSEITFMKPDGTSFMIGANEKFTITKKLVSEDASYETAFCGAFLKELTQDGTTVTMEFFADYTQEELKSIKKERC